MRRHALLLLCTGCVGSLVASLQAKNRDSAFESAPADVKAAKANLDLGPEGYARLLVESPKRGPKELISVRFCVDYGPVTTAFMAEAPPGTRVAYLDDVFIKSMSTTLGSVSRLFELGLQTGGDPTGVEIHPVSPSRCPSGATWLEEVGAARPTEADVYLWLQLSVKQPMPECPTGRGWHVEARWSSAYQPQEHVFEIDFCEDPQRGAKLVAAHVIEHVHTALRATLPSASERVRLTPPHRYEWWAQDFDRHGGSGHHHHH